jgi:hypothetical protein
MSQQQTIAGVGRLFRGQRTLGCVGYRLEVGSNGQIKIVQFDPVPDGGRGDVFSLNLGDGRILECEAAEHCQYFHVLGDGPHAERRVNRRPSAVSRALS